MSALIYLQPRDNPEYFFRQLIHDINTNFSAGTSGSGGGSPIQNGLNTYTGGTISAQTINVSALTIDNVYVSGSSLFNTISASTYYSGSTPLQTIINQISSGATGGFSGWTNSTGIHSIVANNGTGNLASSQYTFTVGYNNSAITSYSSVLGGYRNLASGSQSSIVGGENNVAYGTESFIGNGKGNKSYGTYSSIVGGLYNFAGAIRTFIGGGQANSATTYNSSVVGGRGNLADSGYAFIGGGRFNKASSNGSIVLGGLSNTASTAYAVVAGGAYNMASGSHSHASGNGVIASGTTSFIHGYNSVAGGTNTNVLGANITGLTDNTTYVDNLNIKTLPNFTAIASLAIDIDGNVVTGSTSSSVNGNFLPLSGGTVTGDTIFTEGITANTISATTYLGLDYLVPYSGATGNINLGNKITNLTNGTDPSDAINLSQIANIQAASNLFNYYNFS